MYRFAKAALNLSGQSARRVAVRQVHRTNEEFNGKHDFSLAAAGAAIFIALWAFVVTRNGFQYYLTPLASQPLFSPRRLSGKKEE
ncbi:hypothetical protein DNTS_033261 [Danionella cerebrum]|uniref:Uncharacterized protein n=1 Tax=Danionella cerebrum TaxID=2873325 RepID=A0A553RL50_9TELE|nr:hypothetical protein DNTS_033261 [Danionella translucida]